MAKPDSKLVNTPVEDLCGNPKNVAPGGGVFDGEPGLPKRTGGVLPEKTRDEVRPLPKKGD